MPRESGSNGLPKLGKAWNYGLKTPLSRFTRQKAIRLETAANFILGIKASLGARSIEDPRLEKAIHDMAFSLEFLSRAITELRFISRYPSTPEEK